MRGADPVNDEFEVGYDQPFERKWYRAELVGRVVMILFAAAAVAGLFGRGPFSHARAISADGALAVDYEPVARFMTPTQISLHIRNESDAPRQVMVALSSRIVEPMGFVRSHPVPDAATSGHDFLTLTFTIAAHQPNARVRLAAQPSGIGPIHLFASTGPGARVDWTQFVVP